MGGSRNVVWAIVGAVVVLSTLAGVVGLGMSLYADERRDAQALTAPVRPENAQSTLARFAVGDLAGLQTPARPTPAPEYMFRDRNGTAVRLSTFQGKVTVVNLWAMWCAPCRAEMPTLAALAHTYRADPDLLVLPINVDATPDGQAQAKGFIDGHRPLPLYSDARFQLPFMLPGKGAMPQTVILDRQGRIRASLAGEADWNGAPARALIDALLAEGAPAA